MAVIPALSGCWHFAAAGAGAYGGYKVKEKSDTAQSPASKEKSGEESNKKESK